MGALIRAFVNSRQLIARYSLDLRDLYGSSICIRYDAHLESNGQAIHSLDPLAIEVIAEGTTRT